MEPGSVQIPKYRVRLLHEVRPIGAGNRIDVLKPFVDHQFPCSCIRGNKSKVGVRVEACGYLRIYDVGETFKVAQSACVLDICEGMNAALVEKRAERGGQFDTGDSSQFGDRRRYGYMLRH